MIYQYWRRFTKSFANTAPEIVPIFTKILEEVSISFRAFLVKLEIAFAIPLTKSLNFLLCLYSSYKAIPIAVIAVIVKPRVPLIIPTLC